MLFTSKFFDAEIAETDAQAKYVGDLLRNLLISVTLFFAAAKVMSSPGVETFYIPKFVIWILLVIFAAELVWRSALSLALRVDRYIWRKANAPIDGWGVFGRFIPFIVVLVTIGGAVMEAVFLLSKVKIA